MRFALVLCMLVTLVAAGCGGEKDPAKKDAEGAGKKIEEKAGEVKKDVEKGSTEAEKKADDLLKGLKPDSK